MIWIIIIMTFSAGFISGAIWVGKRCERFKKWYD